MAIKSGRVGVRSDQVDVYGRIKGSGGGSSSNSLPLAVVTGGTATAIIASTSSQDFVLTDGCVIVIKMVSKSLSNLNTDRVTIKIDNNSPAYIRSGTSGINGISSTGNYILCVYEQSTNRLIMVQNLSALSPSISGIVNYSYYQAISSLLLDKKTTITPGETTNYVTFGTTKSTPRIDYVGYAVNGSSIRRLIEGVDYNTTINTTGFNIMNTTGNCTVTFTLTQALTSTCYFVVSGDLTNPNK